MKHLGSTSIITLIALGFFMIACSEQKPAAEKITPESAKVENLATTPEDIKKEAQDLKNTSMTYLDEQMAEYKQKVTEKMALFKYKQREIQAKLAIMNEQAKTILASETEELKIKRAQLDAKILELYTSSSEAFGDLKEGMDNAIEDMEKSYDQALERINK